MREKKERLIVGELKAGDPRTRAVRERRDIVVQIKRIARESVAVEEFGRGGRGDGLRRGDGEAHE